MEGGQYYNNSWMWAADMWASFDLGVTWFQLNGATSMPPRSLAGMTFDPSGYLHITNGLSTNWAWLSDQYKTTYSFNNIQTWAATTVPNLCMPASMCPATRIKPCVAPTSSSTGVASSTGQSPSTSSGLSNGAIAGIVIGSVVGGLLILSLCICFFCMAGKGKKGGTQGSDASHDDLSRHSDEVEMGEGPAAPADTHATTTDTHAATEA